MAQYIDKNAVVAQANIEITNCRLAAEKGILTEFGKGKLEGLEGIVDFLNTLEVKEVDLEKHLKENIEDVFFDLDGVAVQGATSYLTVEDIKDIAKYFFELGLKAQKGE